MLVIQCVVSYRSIPKILHLFNEQTSLDLPWTPHFSSVINWTLRLGLGLLNQVSAIKPKWVAIVDYSIDVGTKKALVVLRVPMDILQRKQRAIQLEDCECIGLKVRDTVNSKTVAADLKDIFDQAGQPDALIKDCDYTLAKGVRDWQSHTGISCSVIDDIGHVAASALRAQYEKSDDYTSFTSALSRLAKRIRQTDIAFLLPPKLRTKGRFQSISTVTKWADKVLQLFERYHNKGEDDKTEDEINIWEKFTQAIPDLAALKPFIQRFAGTTLKISQMLKVLKHKGLNEETAKQCQVIVNDLSDDTVKVKFQTWLDKTLAIHQVHPECALPVSSDIIESLFGNFKQIISRSPQADMNRSVLIIPALCGRFSEQDIKTAFSHASQKELIKWEKEHIPYTIRGKRTDFFGSQKVG